MKHTKLQRLTFFEFLSRRIDNKYLDKIVEKHRNNTPIPERKYIEGLVDNVDVTYDEEILDAVALIYCLHVEKVKEGYTDMFVKDLLNKTEFDLTEDNVVDAHEKLTEILGLMNLPKLSLDKVVAQNIALYSEDFKKKFGRFI